MVDVHAGQGILRKHVLSNFKGLFKSHFLVAGVVDGNHLSFWLFIGTDLTQKNGVSSNVCFGGMIGDGLSDLLGRDGALHEYILRGAFFFHST